MPSSTMHHQLRRATDSQSLSALAEPFKMYTLQGSIHPATVSGVPARMTAHVHSSPLAKVTLVASSVSPPSNSLLDAELDEEMERMVASVVNSPVEPGLSSELLPAPESISLAGPKLSIASQAALGSYRQRGLSGNVT